MRIVPYRALTLLVVMGAVLGCSESSLHDDVVILIDDDEPQMAAAIKKGRETLPQFWRVFEKRENGETNFALKVKITDGDTHEHFWLTNLQRKQGKIFGTVDNDPQIVSNVRMGERLPIPEENISDWLYLRDGKMHGNFTIRPLFKSMPPEEVQQLKQMLAEPDSE